MAEKTIAKQLSETNAQLEQLTAKLSEASTLIAALETEKASLSANLATANTELKTITDAKAQSDKAVADLTTAHDSEKARADLAESKLTLKAFDDLGGRKPLNDDSSGDKGEGVTTWTGALAKCGGDYVKARTQFPKAYEAFMLEQRKK